MKKYYLVFLIILAVVIPVMLLVFTFLHKKGQEIQDSPKTKIDSLVPTVGSYNVAVTRQHLPTNSKDTERLPTREPGSPVPGCPDDSLGWKEYSDPNNRFSIHYPGTTSPQLTEWFKDDPELVSRVGFDFHPDIPVNTGTYGTYLQITVWKNPNRLNATEWTKQKYPNQKIPDITTTSAITVAGREGFMFRTRMAPMRTTLVDIYVADKDSVYELNYTDINTEEGYPSNLRSCWASLYSKMIESFTL